MHNGVKLKGLISTYINWNRTASLKERGLTNKFVELFNSRASYITRFHAPFIRVFTILKGTKWRLYKENRTEGWDIHYIRGVRHSAV